MRRMLLPFLLTGALMPAAPAAPVAARQVELDRTLQRVYETPIMASDVRRVRMLRLTSSAGGSDEEVLTVLENRLLVLREVARGAVAEPSAVMIKSRRDAWASAWPPGTDVTALMARSGMTDQALNGWFRDELIIETYYDQRFGQANDARRAERIAEWTRDLRRRANLPVR
jgi:hypothetical protein